MGKDQGIEHLEGVSLIPLRQIADQRGKLMHILRADAPHFTQFGEVYGSFVNPGVIKGWKQHTVMEQNFAVPLGHVKIVLVDARVESPTYKLYEEIDLGEDERLYRLLKIPPRIWYSFKGLAPNPSLLINCSSHPHSPTEAIGMDLNSSEIAYRWDTGRAMTEAVLS